MALKFVPSLSLIYLSKQRLNRTLNYVILLLSYVITFSSGYEFATVTIVCFIITHYCLYPERYRIFIDSLKQICGALLLSFSALCITLSLHFLSLSFVTKSASLAFREILKTVVKRTGASELALPVEYGNSLSAPPLQVLKNYFSMPIFGSPFNLPLFNLITIYVLFLIVLILSFISTNQSDQRFLSTNVWLTASLGPIAWYLLARPHAAGHVHLDYAIWYFPTVPLGVCLIFDRIRRNEYSLLLRASLRMWSVYLMLLIVLFVFASLTVRN